MANTNRPSGFKPVANLTGGGEYISNKVHRQADTTAIGKFDFVNPTGGLTLVEQYDNADPVWGVALNYVPASILGDVSVMHINHMSLLEAQEDSDGGAIAAASEGLNAEVVVAAANTYTGLSQMTLDSSTVNTTASFATRLIRPVPRIGNTVASNYCRWFVTPLELDIAEAKAGL